MLDPQLVFQQIRQLKLTADDLKKEVFEAKAGNVKVTLSGELKILDITLPKANPVLAKALKTALNSAIKKAQKKTMFAIKKMAA